MNSAGGSAKDARDRKTQAVLGLRGKILNVFKANEKQIHSNTEIETMIRAFGTGIGDDFNIDDPGLQSVIESLKELRVGVEDEDDDDGEINLHVVSDIHGK